MQLTSIETEQQLLGCLIYTNAVIFDLDITEDDFAHPQHGKLFAEMKRHYAEKQNFAVADFIGYGEDYIQALADAVHLPSKENILSYSARLIELSKKRRILDAIKTAESMMGTHTANEVLSYVQSGLNDNFDCSSLKTAEQVFEEIVSDLELPPVKYSTGLKQLDQAMGGGFFEGFTYGLAGAEKAGKTTFAHTISHNLSEGGCMHAYVALEMGSKQIEQRNLARKMGVNSLQFLNQTETVKEKIHGLKPNKNTIYFDAPGADLDTILTNIGIAKLRYGIKGFIVDYWQLVEGQAHTEEKHLRTVAQGLANFARKQKLWCLLLAQRNADGKLFGGGGLKKACDQLYFIEKPEHYEDGRWLSMDASRYTPKADVGSDSLPAFCLNKKIGPFIVSN